jgi:hypothetical protein
MKTNLKIVTLLVALSLLLAVPAFSFLSPVETIQSYFSSVSNGDYIAAAKLFKYPKYSSDAEYNNDIQTVSNDLKDLVSDFGIAESLNQTNAVDGSYAGFGVSAGSPEHVEKYPPQNVVHMQVTFSKIGRGYISFLFNNADGDDELIMVFYSIPRDVADKLEI